MSEPVLLLVPVKRWDRAKSRLSAGARPVADPQSLAEAFARDAITAALACARVRDVYVVCDQPDFSVPGARRLPDEGAGDLNAAITAAEARLRRQHAGAGIAAMCADLPCLRAGDLATAVADALDGPEPRAYVADADGTGTTLLLARDGRALDPRFGTGSARLHEASGARPVRQQVPSLRRDVDTVEDLAAATALGVGAHTRALLTGAGRTADRR